MTADERMARIRVKIERAKKHIDNLYSEVTAYLENRPYLISSKVNAHPTHPHRIYYLAEVNPVPDSIRVITGDILFNVRAALDHLAYQLVLIRGFVDDQGAPLSEGDQRDIYFPILDVETAEEYEASNSRKRKVKGMSQVAREAIDRTKPYKGGNKTLWRLHKLHNIDKHRLVITATSALHSVSFEPGAFDGDYAMYRNVIIAREDRRYPVEKGDEIFVDFRNPKLDQQIQPFFQVMLNEPGIVECEPLLETVHYMVDLVEHIVATFKPLLV